jgi:hypothetical protein
MRTVNLAALTLFVAASATGLAAQERFDWRGRVDRGKAIEIKGINGEITAVAASGNEVRVSAEKTGRRSDPDDVKIEVVEHDGGVTICAVYPSGRGGENECRPGSGGRMNVRDNDVNVDFRVEVPAGVVFVARNVNGGVTATSLQSDVRAWTVNGGIDVRTSGIVQANSVNGAITAAMGGSAWSGTLEFETVNGSIAVEIGGELNAEVRASTVNGGISTDFPLTIQGRFGPRRLNGTVGSGGRTLSLTTVNGEIELKKR